ncbi:purine-binding chemotaxis protein CheW [Vibrio aquaticus]|uniref:Purine-binding chemotaxis protein CheW n=1 Tax=Vibrio aquaticus TaxID=2496559 RepID=A0A432CZI7_9VIBR|nr:chemotaxis protein CheW [Vibrio aquaticus]RTZ16578.1 purine-binding chemotaxis protein CheW [Vibrio aquaticus]
MKEKYLEFKVADKYFAYPIHSIREIIEYPNIEQISGAPQQLLGVMNLRGNLVVVFDIASCLGEPTTPVTTKTCVIVTEVLKENVVYVVANKVDLVRQVIDISQQEMEEVPKLGGHFESPMVQGVAKLDERLLTILNVERLLSHQQWSWLTEAQAQQELNHG